MPKLLPPNINPAFAAAVHRMLGTAVPRKKAAKKSKPKKNGARN